MGLKFADTQCGFKAFTRAAAQTVFQLQTIERWGFDPEILFIALKRGYRVEEVPVSWAHDERTRMSYLKDGMKMLEEIAIVRWNALLGRYGKQIEHIHRAALANSRSGSLGLTAFFPGLISDPPSVPLTGCGLPIPRPGSVSRRDEGELMFKKIGLAVLFLALGSVSALAADFNGKWTADVQGRNGHANSHLRLPRRRHNPDRQSHHSARRNRHHQRQGGWRQHLV